ncbi:hypothetical protein ACFVZI_50395, partial [Streptomyces mirabilis]
GRGQDYYLRKIAEGKTPAEARRALKRRLSNVVTGSRNETVAAISQPQLDTQRRYRDTPCGSVTADTIPQRQSTRL